MTAPLACTVRGCGLALDRTASALRCAAGHTYDVARSGYVNLLQPQDRRSLDAGDAKDTVAARVRLRNAGLGTKLESAIMAQLDACAPPAGGVIVDLGCGAGQLLTAIAAQRQAATIGIDLSMPAIEQAARNCPDATWVVANADRRLPLLDGSVDAIVSVHARRHPEECARVLTAAGVLLVAVPAPDDLIELRTSVQGAGTERDRVEALIEAHLPFFTVAGRQRVSERRDADGEVLRDLLHITYRGARRTEAAAAATLSRMTVTLASDVVVFRVGQ